MQLAEWPLTLPSPLRTGERENSVGSALADADRVLQPAKTASAEADPAMNVVKWAVMGFHIILLHALHSVAPRPRPSDCGPIFFDDPILESPRPLILLSAREPMAQAHYGLSNPGEGRHDVCPNLRKGANDFCTRSRVRSAGNVQPLHAVTNMISLSSWVVHRQLSFLHFHQKILADGVSVSSGGKDHTRRCVSRPRVFSRRQRSGPVSPAWFGRVDPPAGPPPAAGPGRRSPLFFAERLVPASTDFHCNKGR